MLKITTETGRVYYLDGSLFMRTGEGRMPGQWFENNEWRNANRISEPQEGKRWRVTDLGSYADPDLWFITSQVVSVEEAGFDA